MGKSFKKRSDLEFKLKRNKILKNKEQKWEKKHKPKIHQLEEDEINKINY